MSDLKTYKIRNSITYSFMAAGLIMNFLAEGFKGMALSLQGILLPVVCLIVLYMLRMIGAGDIKLFSAIGAIMGAGFTMYSIVYSFILGGVIALLLILARRNGVWRFRYLLVYLKSCFLLMKPIEYADFEDKHYESKFHFSIAAALGTTTAAILKIPII